MWSIDNRHQLQHNPYDDGVDDHQHHHHYHYYHNHYHRHNCKFVLNVFFTTILVYQKIQCEVQQISMFNICSSFQFLQFFCLLKWLKLEWKQQRHAFKMWDFDLTAYLRCLPPIAIVKGLKISLGKNAQCPQMHIQCIWQLLWPGKCYLFTFDLANSTQLYFKETSSG